MSEQFKPTAKHKKKIIILIAVGVFMLLAGIIATPSEIKHGGHEHHPLIEPVQNVETTHGKHDAHGDAHKEAHGEHAEHGAAHGHGDDHGHGHEHASHEPARDHKYPLKLTTLATALMIGGFYFTCIALFGGFFIAVGYIANAGWYVTVKRVAETFYMFLPIAGFIMVIVGIMSAMGITYWRWSDVDVSADHILSGKTAILNSPVLIGTMILFFAVWTVLGFMLRKFSLMEDQVGGLTYHKKSTMISAIFLPFFGLSFSLAAFEWIMSLEPHWFSTIFAVYCFAGLFVLGATTLMLISINLRESGFLPEFNGEHRHDLGKFMFAFSIFWAYIWVSQYLLIWYANIPEETLYFVPRQDNYPLLFYANLVINFAFPFLAFMTRDGKRKEDWIKLVASVILFGRFLDIYLMIAPGMLGDQWGIGSILASAGVVCLLGGLFLAVVYRGLSKAPLLPKNHPYLKESLTYDTGI